MSNIEQLSNLFIENWTSVFNTILGKDVKVEIEPVEKIPLTNVLDRASDYESFVSASYSENEKIAILTKNKLISVVSNLMIGLDSFSDEINDDDKDAFVEGVNQMFASCQVPIKETLGLDIKFTDVSFIEQDDILNVFNGNEVNYWKISIDLPDISVEKFILITPLEFCENGSQGEDDLSINDDYSDNGSERSSKSNGINGIQGYEGSNIDLILDVELPITIRIGSTEKKLVEIMRLGLGSIIELEKVVDDPVDVLVNNKLVAKGEVVVLDSNFAIRIIEVESREKRIKSLV